MPLAVLDAVIGTISFIHSCVLRQVLLSLISGAAASVSERCGKSSKLT